MAPFKKRKPSAPAAPRSASAPSVNTWTPTVDLATARPIVIALANAPSSSDSQVRAAIAGFGRLSDRPDDEYQLARLMLSDPGVAVLQRPWVWLVAVMREGAAAGDHHLAAACLFWACYWTNSLVPRGNLGFFLDVGLDPIEPQLKAEILALGRDSAQQLPHDFYIVGDSTGAVEAGWLAEAAPSLLSR